MSCSSSSESASNDFSDEDSDTSMFSDNKDFSIIKPYEFEPSDSDSSSADNDSDHDPDDVEDRLKTLSWCKCGYCVIMPTQFECVCCMDIKEIINKMTVDKIKQPCITLHPGFSSVCLCVWVLQAAGSKHQKNRGTSINE
jgi:hypothetical protein